MTEAFPTLSPYEVLNAGKWHSALFTTFSLSLSFFEAVPLHALRARGARDATILTDLVGYRSSLSEAGVADAGRSYDLVPLAVAGGGCFHPKIMVLVGDDGVRATVGSGNLTFGGWGHNLEVIDYLAPKEAPRAFLDLADLLESLILETDEPGGRLASDRALNLEVFHQACLKAGQTPGDGRTRVLHTLRGSIASQLAAHADELGGATSLSIVSPFFGGPGSVHEFATLLQCKGVRICVPARSPEFFDFAEAEAAGLQAEPVGSSVFTVADRLLHAKVIDVQCRHGRLVLSGSVNATRPALIEASNIEAAVLRFVDDRLTFGWGPGDRPKVTEGEGLAFASTEGPCLVARFDGRVLSGRLFGVLEPGGTWEGWLVAGSVHLSLGALAVDDTGSFIQSAQEGTDPLQLTRAAQVVLARDGVEVRGWLVLDQILAAVRERGHTAEAMIRALAGSEEPDDISTILEFFAGNPEAFLEDDAGEPTTAGSGTSTTSGAKGLIELHALRPTDLLEERRSALACSTGASAFERLLASMRRYMRYATGTTPSRLVDAEDLEAGEDEHASNPHAVPRWRIESAIEAIIAHVANLPDNAPGLRRHVVSVLDFVLFAADRSDDPESLRSVYLTRWLAVALRLRAAADVDVLDRAYAGVVVSRVLEDPAQAARVHGWLQEWRRDHLDPAWSQAVAPSGEDLRERRLAAHVGAAAWSHAWQLVLSSSTAWTRVNALLEALARGGALPDLPTLTGDELSLLQRIVQGRARPDQLMKLNRRSKQPGCPKCHYNLPLLQRERLREHRIATAPCCGRLLVDAILD